MAVFLQMMNSIWKKLILQFVADFKIFENTVDAKGEIVVFVMVTSFEEVKEKKISRAFKFLSQKKQRESEEDHNNKNLN